MNIFKKLDKYFEKLNIKLEMRCNLIQLEMTGRKEKEDETTKMRSRSRYLILYMSYDSFDMIYKIKIITMASIYIYLSKTKQKRLFYTLYILK